MHFDEALEFALEHNKEMEYNRIENQKDKLGVCTWKRRPLKDRDNKFMTDRNDFKFILYNNFVQEACESKK